MKIKGYEIKWLVQKIQLKPVYQKSQVGVKK